MTLFRYLRVKPKKRGLNWQSMPILSGGASSYPTPGHVTRKWTVNTTLARGHHSETRRTTRNFFLFSHANSMPITIQYYFSDWGRRIKPGSISGDTISICTVYAYVDVRMCICMCICFSNACIFISLTLCPAIYIYIYMAVYIFVLYTYLHSWASALRKITPASAFRHR